MAANQTSKPFIQELGANTTEYVVNHTKTPDLQQYNIDMCGYSVARDGYQFKRPKSWYQLILACTGGEGEVQVGNTWVDCQPNQVYMGPYGKPHAFQVKPGVDWHLVWILFAEPRASEENQLAEMREASLITADVSGFKFAMQGLYSASKKEEDAMLINAWLRVLEIHAKRFVKGEIFDPRVNNVWRMVQQDLSKDWSLPSLAQLANMSAENFRRLCQMEMQESPMHYLKKMRMERAGELLVLTSSSVESICYAVGYTNQFSFSTAFKSYFGLSPAQYRKANIKKRS